MSVDPLSPPKGGGNAGGGMLLDLPFFGGIFTDFLRDYRTMGDARVAGAEVSDAVAPKSVCDETR
jgi:hypothetical protein